MTPPLWQQKLAVAGNRIPAPAILIVALITIQFSSALAKMILTEDNLFGLSLFRIAFGSALLWIIVRPRWQALNRSAWIDAVLLGVAYALMNVFAYMAFIKMPFGLAVTIGFLGPLSVSLLHSRTTIEFVWPILGFVGVYLLAPSHEGAEINWSAMVIAGIYATCWAGYILASARAGRSIQGLDGFVIAGPVATILLLPFGWTTAGQFFASFEVFWFAMLVMITVTIPFGLEFIALKRIEPRVFGILLSLEPAIASIIGMGLLQEFLSLKSWIAIVIVTVAASGAALVKKEANE